QEAGRLGEAAYYFRQASQLCPGSRCQARADELTANLSEQFLPDSRGTLVDVLEGLGGPFDELANWRGADRSGQELLSNSEDLHRMVEEWERIWFDDQRIPLAWAKPAAQLIVVEEGGAAPEEQEPPGTPRGVAKPLAFGLAAQHVVCRPAGACAEA